MKKKTILACGTAAAVLSVSGANAATIHLVDLGGVTGSVAEQDFNIAANYWANMFTNNVTIDLGVKFAALPKNVMRQATTRPILRNRCIRPTSGAAIRSTRIPRS
jgi:hypothetical protein